MKAKIDESECLQRLHYERGIRMTRHAVYQVIHFCAKSMLLSCLVVSKLLSVFIEFQQTLQQQ